MDDPTPIHSPSKPDPNPEGARVPPRLAPVDPQWAFETGLLHHLNEAVLWPIGFAIVIGKFPDGTPGILLTEANGPILLDIPPEEHLAIHNAFVAMLAHRFTPRESSIEELAAAEARKRLVLPR